MIHRDVKPHNLLLTANHEVVLSDFGLAVVEQSLNALSLSNPAAGTPLYMAPEQIQYRPCPASDQYALGIMVYEWLAGEVPFHGSTLLEVFSHHLFQALPSLCERLPDLPTAVEEVVFKALAKDPEHRFACVMDFALALEQAGDGTQPLTLHGLPKPQTHESAGSQNMWFVPTSPAREQADDAFSTQPQPITVQRLEQGQEGVSVIVPGPVLHNQTVSKVVKPALAQSNQQRFLRRVRTIWIDGMLDHSLQGATLIALGLQEQLDALANPWHLVLQHPDTAPRSFPLGTRITEVYDAADSELLILGAPGSGKTTLLLELTRDLLSRAEQDTQQPMPVVFILSSWAAKQQPLAEWMIEELISKYQLPHHLARTWMETNLILPLLDGLDEVETSKRTTCIETINAYHREHAFLPLVVSSRSADYVQQGGRLKLNCAVTIQPLTQQQVDDYLARGGEALWALRVALHQDASLRELAETPLMLSILTLTYHDMPVEDLLKGGVAPTRQQIFDRYVNRMVVHRSGNAQNTPEQTKDWLTWLAKQLVQRGQTMFYIEQLQPDWLLGSRTLRWYKRLAVRLPAILIGILITFVITNLLFTFDIVTGILLGGLLGGLLSERKTSQRATANGEKVRRIPWRQFVQQLLVGILIGLGVGLNYRLFYGLSVGLSVGLCSLLLQVLLVKSNTAQSLSQIRPSDGRTKWQRLIRSPVLQNGLLAGLLVGLSFGLFYGLRFGLLVGLRFGLFYGLSYGLSSGFLSLVLIRKSSTIQVTDRLIWSWTRLGQSLWLSQHARAALQIATLVGLSFGLIDVLSFGLLNGLSFGPIDVLGLVPGLIDGLLFGLISGLSYWLLIGLFQGVSSEIIGDQQRIAPNQGIRHSAFNGFVLGCISALVCGLLTGLLFELLYNLSSGPLSSRLSGLLYGLLSRLLASQFSGSISDLRIDPGGVLVVTLIVGLSAGLLAGLLKGGLASLRHYVLRFLLWRAGTMPWNYPHFLDSAAEHILLRKVGGGYIFIHRFLLEYFASLDTPSPPDAARVKYDGNV